MTTVQTDLTAQNADALVGERVHLLAWRAGITHKDIARRLGFDYGAAVSKKIRGQRGWTVAELVTVADMLGVQAAELIAGVEPLPAGNEQTAGHGGRRSGVRHQGLEPRTR